jgi:hypothetical protein
MVQLKLWKISQNENTDYDTYDSAIVCAENELEASRFHPGIFDFSEEHNSWGFKAGTGAIGRERKEFEAFDTLDWATKPSQVKVEYIGIADKSIQKGIVLSSFNAG